VIHDWGSALGFDWANHHRHRVRGIAYMEGIVRPLTGWDEWSKRVIPIFQGFRSAKGSAGRPENSYASEKVTTEWRARIEQHRAFLALKGGCVVALNLPDVP
jgi:pimeloyl-ACP methyl ester carboxylesterase